MKIEFKYFKCSSNGTDCVETKLRYHFDDLGDFELKREKRSIWTPWGKREPICRLDCTCDPDVSSNIDQASAIKQKSDQKQKVTVQQAFGIGSVLAVIGMARMNSVNSVCTHINRIILRCPDRTCKLLFYSEIQFISICKVSSVLSENNLTW